MGQTHASGESGLSQSDTGPPPSDRRWFAHADRVTSLRDPGVDVQRLSDQPEFGRAVVPSPSLLTDSQNESSLATNSRGIERVRALLPLLDGIRALLAQSWSPTTAYSHIVTEDQWMNGDPRGQCGVSSVLLAKVLHREYSIGSTFCSGSLIFDSDAENVPEHCWLEIHGESGDEIILDLTGDQARGFDQPIVCDSKANLELNGVHYISHERVDAFDLSQNPAWPRYELLLQNMVATMVAALGGWLRLTTLFGESADKSHKNGS